MDFLDNRSLRLTPHTEFNDPFEFFAGVGISVPSIKTRLRHLLNPKTYLRSYLEAGYHKRGEKDYETWVRKLAPNDDLWRKEMKCATDAFVHGTALHFGIVCFMDAEKLLPREGLKHPFAVHLWDRYADAHRGLAVRLAINDPTDARDHLSKLCRRDDMFFPVKYRSKRSLHDPGIGKDDADFLKVLRKRSREKSAVWGYEKEWRLMVPVNPTRGDVRNLVSSRVNGDKIIQTLRLWDLDQTSPITDIYLGIRASKDLEANVLLLCQREDLHHVRVHRAQPCEHSYGFEYQAI